MTSSAGAKETRYPAFMAGTISVLKYAMFSFIEGANFSCVAPYNFLDAYWTQTGFVVGALLLIVLLHRIVLPAAFAHNPLWFGGDAHPARDKLIKVCVFGMNILYPSLSSISLAMFRCQSVGARSYLAADLSIDCDSGAFRAAWIFNVCFCALIVVGWPAFLLFFLWRAKKVLQSAHSIAGGDHGYTMKEAARRTIWAMRELQKLLPFTSGAQPDQDPCHQVEASVKGTTDVLLRLRYRHFSDREVHHRSQSTTGGDSGDGDNDSVDVFRRQPTSLQTDAERLNQRVGFLYDSLRQSCMFWSIGEMMRQILLIGCLRFFDAASALRLVFPNVVSGIFLCVHLIYMPYVSRALNALKGAQLSLICLTYQFTLLVSLSSLSPLDADTGAVALGFVTVASIVCAVLPVIVGLALWRAWLSVHAWDAFLSRLGDHEALPFEEAVEPLSAVTAPQLQFAPAMAAAGGGGNSTTDIELQPALAADARSHADARLPSWMRKPAASASAPAAHEH